MPTNKKTRRAHIILCDDLTCKFKQKNRGLTKIAQECSLDTEDAIRFFKKYGFTTCEVGMGEEVIHPDHITNEMLINKLKYKGRV